jgi:hypothetical protein
MHAINTIRSSSKSFITSSSTLLVVLPPFITSLATSDAGRTLIVSVTKSGSGNVTDAVLSAVQAQLTLAGGDGSGTDQGGPDAFTIAGVGIADGSAFVSGTTTVVFLRVQGTGTPNLAEVSGATLATVAVFAPAL